MSDFDITVLILGEHDAFRRSFAELEQLSDPEQLGSRWKELADQLEVHASGEETIFYPGMLQDVPDSEADTKHAIRDHNEIRDAVRAVPDEQVGSSTWWEAVSRAREVNAEHLDEEERDVLPAFRDSIEESRRSELGVRWLAFHEEHERARGLSGRDKDPEQYVDQHS